MTLHDGTLAPGAGGIYFTRNGGADRATTNALDEHLQPTGLRIVDMEACCGDPGGGLFICRPSEQGR